MAGGDGDCTKYKYLIDSYDWDTDIAMKVCKIESGGNPTATNWSDSHSGCSGSFGIFQVGCLHGVSKDSLYNPIVNIETAYKIYKEQGWGAWTTTMKKLGLGYMI